MPAKLLTPVQKIHKKYMESLYTDQLWTCFAKIMSKDHVNELNNCTTIKEKEMYLLNVDYLFKQYAANYKIPKHVIKKSNTYITLCTLTKYNFRKRKFGKGIKLCIIQLETCALRKTTSKRRFTKNKLIIKSDWACVDKAFTEKGTHYDSEWAWVHKKYYKNIEKKSSDKPNNKWVPLTTWSLDIPKQ